MARVLGYVLLVVGGFTAAMVLAEPGFATYPLTTGFGPGPVFASDTGAVAVGSVVAVLTAALCRARSTVATAVLAGAALVGIVALPGAWRYDMYVATVGAGLLLGALAAACREGALAAACHEPRRLPQQSALAGGAVAGVVAASPIAEYRQFAGTPGRYADYLAVSEQPVDTVWLVLAVATILMTVAALVVGGFDTDGRSEPVVVRELVVGVGIPIVAVVLHWSFHRAVYMQSEDFDQGRWLLGIVVVPIVIVAALWLRDRTGTVLLAAAALFVSVAAAADVVAGTWPMLSIPLLLVAAGVWLGRRYPVPLIGVGVLALAAATAIVERAPWDNLNLAATIFAVPFAAGYTIVASLPSTAPVTTTALTMPAVMSLPLMAQFGWTAYTPLTDAPLSGGDTGQVPEWVPSAWTSISVGVSVVSIVACGAAMVWLRRRPVPTA
ncbi:MAG: hypothetical protein WAX14_08925 [Rhodococcus sp. (in: high G+C Gram-positive bacteria)]|uniref:hypothetical protein n=1 Tax=Rhodococcus sp. TaxID=1831 RepID=UPI003BB554E6